MKIIKLYCKDNGQQYGIVGTETSLKDINGTSLFVGDVVILKRKDCKWSKMRFVAWDEKCCVPYVIGDYFEMPEYDFELVVRHNMLEEGFGIGNVYYVKD